MRLLVSLIKFEQGWGGAPESIRLLARRLHPCGIRCDVVTNRGFIGDVARFDLLPKAGAEVEHESADMADPYDAFLIVGPWQPYMRLRRIMKRLPSSAQMLHLPRGGLATAEFVRLRDMKKLPYLALLEQRLIERADRIIFSSTIEDEKTWLIGAQRTKRIVIPDIVEPVPQLADPQAPARDATAPFTMTFMAESAPRKGLLQMLKAFRMLDDVGRLPRDMVLNVGGVTRPGSERYDRRCRALAATLPIDVRFLGSVAHDDRAALYASTDLFLTPSSFESFGLTVIEALSAGCRLLTTPDLGSLEFLPVSPAITIAADATPAGLASGFKMATATCPGKVSDAEAAVTRRMCEAAIAAINTTAVTAWKAILTPPRTILTD